MGYIREPKNVDLTVEPTVFTQETKNKITQAIAQYKKTGKKPVSVEFITEGVISVARVKSNTTGKVSSARRQAKI